MGHLFFEVACILAALVSSFGHAQQCGVIVSYQTDFVNTVSTAVEDTFEELSCPGFETSLNTISSAVNTLGTDVETSLNTISSAVNTLGTDVESRLNTIETTVESRLDTIATAVDSIQQRLDTISEQISSSDRPPQSCADIFSSNNNAPSGMYEVRNAAGQSQTVYCDMTTECGGVRGWTRIAYLNSNESCPVPPLVAPWGRPVIQLCRPIILEPPSCTSIHYPSGGILYNKVCGRVYVHSEGGVDDFRPENSMRQPPLTIDSNYVDGVSLTHGSPRQHIWTFATTIHCTCAQPPAFVGNSYFCSFSERQGLQKPLFAGQPCAPRYCAPNSSPCTPAPNSSPWFYKELPPSPTSDDIELRLCTDGYFRDELNYLSLVEVLVR